MEFIEEEARKVGVRALHLEVMGGNDAALQLYRRLGFREHKSSFHSKWIARDGAKPAGTHGY